MVHSEETLQECAKALSEYCEEMQEKTGYECTGCIFKQENGCRISGMHSSTKIEREDFGIEMSIVMKLPSDWYQDGTKEC